MPKYRVVGDVVASAFIAEVEAADEETAMEMVEKMGPEQLAECANIASDFYIDVQSAEEEKQ